MGGVFWVVLFVRFFSFFCFGLELLFCFGVGSGLDLTGIDGSEIA